MISATEQLQPGKTVSSLNFAGTLDVDEKDRFGSNYLAQTAYPIAFLWRINHQVSVLTRFAEIAHLKLFVEEGFGSKFR